MRCSQWNTPTKVGYRQLHTSTT